MTLPVPTPVYCRPDAFELFAASVPRLGNDYGLLMAAIAVSMHGVDDVDPEAIDRSLQRLADTVRARVLSGDRGALLAHAHQLLFDELGFHGNETDYHDPANSYLPLVLERRTGLPITLALVYKVVLGRLGLGVEGINAPGHFLVTVCANGPAMLIDPYFGGRKLSRAEALRRIAATTGQPAPDADDALPIASHRAWIGRMLRNLHATFLRAGQREDMAAMLELGRLLG